MNLYDRVELNNTYLICLVGLTLKEKKRKIQSFES